MSYVHLLLMGLIYLISSDLLFYFVIVSACYYVSYFHFPSFLVFRKVVFLFSVYLFTNACKLLFLVLFKKKINASTFDCPTCFIQGNKQNHLFFSFLFTYIFSCVISTLSKNITLRPMLFILSPPLLS